MSGLMGLTLANMMSLSFDDLLSQDEEVYMPDLPDLPDLMETSLEHRQCPSHHSSTHSHSPPLVLQEAPQVQVRRSFSAPQAQSIHLPRRSPLPSLSIQIDPALLNPQAQIDPLEINPLDLYGAAPRRDIPKFDNILLNSPSDWLAHTPPFPYSRQSLSPKESNKEHLAKSWQIDTVSGASSEAGSEVQSPLTPGYSSSSGINEEIAKANGESPQASKGEKSKVPPPKKSHARKEQPEGHIKRARNAFILFRKHVTDSGLIPPSVEVKHQNISVVAAKMWREAPQEVRQKFQEQARIEKEEHQRLYPGYRYQPVFRRTDIIRRRVRKDAAEEEKVEAVAEALINGKAGDALEKEIKDQMVQRTNEVEAEVQAERGSRRRRRDQGQLSKGAIRAQRAQARARQMRQNLLGTNLLSMSMYNAQQQAQRSMTSSFESYYDPAQHAHAHAHASHEHGHYAYDDAYNYQLAPIAYPDPGAYYPEYYHGVEYAPEAMEYQLPPLGLDHADTADEQGEDPRMQGWTGGGHQTPSGHVVFNERLFEGLASGGLSERRDDGLGSFEEAVAQADLHAW